MKKLFKLIVTAVAFSVCALSAQAQVISVQFLKDTNATNGLASGTVAGVDPVTNWNVSNASSTNTVLNDNSGTATTATLTVQAGRYFTGNAFPTGGDNQLLAGGLNSYAGNTASTLSFATIPYTTYDVIVYGTTDNNANVDSPGAGLTTTFALTPTGGTTQYFSLQPSTTSSSYLQSTNTFNGSGTPPTTGFTVGANYVEFTGLTTPSFSLLFSGLNGTGGGFNASLNGVQIIEAAATPEPSTYLMVGIGLLVLVVLRKRLARV